MTDVVYTPDEAAGILKVSVRTLARWRSKGVGPRFVQVNQVVRYVAADLDEWLACAVRTAAGQ